MTIGNQKLFNSSVPSYKQLVVNMLPLISKLKVKKRYPKCKTTINLYKI